MLEIVRSDFCIGYTNNIVMSIWHGQLTRSHIAQIRAVFEKVAAQSPQGFGAMTVVAQDAAPVAPDARKPLTEIYEAFPNSLKGVSLVIEADGVKGMTLRFLIGAIQTLIRPSYPIEIHESLDVGGKWLGERLGNGNALSELRALQAEYESRRGSAAP